MCAESDKLNLQGLTLSEKGGNVRGKLGMRAVAEKPVYSENIIGRQGRTPRVLLYMGGEQTGINLGKHGVGL